jgi:hypothetical protein
MALSPHLAILELITSQSNKDVTINAAIDALSRGNGYLSLSVAGTGTLNLTADQSRYGVIEATGILTGNRILNIPANFDHNVLIFNNTTGAFTLSVQWNGGTATLLPRGCFTPVRKNAAASAFDYRSGGLKLPEVIVNRATSTQAMTNNAETVIQWNAENRDTAEAFDSTTNWRFTAPVAGLYKVNATVEIDVSGAVAGNYNGHIAIRVNGTVVRRGEQYITGTQAASTTCRHSVQGLVQLAASDTVDIVFSNGHTAGTLVVDFGIEKTYMEVFCIRFGT